MVDNINTNTMVGKVVAVCIALLFIVVLAFPIANSLSNMGKEDDGGPITYTNTGDFYYKSTTLDTEEHIGKFIVDESGIYDPINDEYTTTAVWSISVDDNVIWTYTGGEHDGEYDSPSLVLGWTTDISSDYHTLYLSDGGILFYPYSFALDLSGTWEEEETETTYEAHGESEFKIQNGYISYVESGTENVRSFPLSYFISDSSGEYVASADPVKVVDDSLIYINCVEDAYDETLDSNWLVSPYGSFYGYELAENPTVFRDKIYDRWYGGDASYTLTIGYTSQNNLITISTASLELDLEYEEDIHPAHTISYTTAPLLYVPTTVTVDPSATTVTATNSGQTYKELDDNSHNIHTESTTNGGVTTVTVVSDDAEIMSFTHIDGDFTPKICLAFGSEGSIWLTNGGFLLMITSDGIVVNMYAGSTYVDILNKMYDSHTYGTVNLEYFISNDGEYVYSETAMASKTGQIFNIGISLCDVGESYPLFASVRSNGTPVSALNDVHVNVNDGTTVNSIAHYTVGDYVELDSLDVTYSFTHAGTDYTVDYSTNGFFVPKTFTYMESPDSDSDSEGLGGIASTLVKLVPILLIVGILLIFVMPMINKPN